MGLEVFSVYSTAGSPHGLTRYVGTAKYTRESEAGDTNTGNTGGEIQTEKRRNTNSGSEGMSNRREASRSGGISVHGVFIQLRWFPFMRSPNRGPA